ncbi:MAG: NUDIX hydrolase [Oscillospiraceae bacterium]|nr:NUDIX hydrolase [Oscillospiraceae bacterium]
MELKETRLSGETVYKGKIVTLKVDEALLPNGATAGREVVEHPGGVCVLALQEDGTVPLVRQFRYPLGDVMLELPAGKLEYGEEPRPAAIRELGEEVGLEPGELTDLGHIYVSPGFCTEKLHMYLAREVKRVPVHPDEDEFLDIVHLPFGELADMVMSGEITDGKTVATVLKTKVLLGL